MTLGYLLPLTAAIVGLLAAARLHHRLPPRYAAFALTGGVVALAVTAASSLAVLAADFALDLAPWCGGALAGHAHVSDAGGVGALVMLGAGCGFAGRAALRQLRARGGAAPRGGVVVVDAPTPTAFAVPGRHAHIVVSRSMLDLLEEDERRAMLAHERAHLRHRHHLLVWATEIAAAMLPPLRPASSRVRLATERWADQEAAKAVGDPHVVARAIARAALARADVGGPVLALAGSDVEARITELIQPAPPRRITDPPAVAALGLAGVSLASSTLQLHQVADLLSTLCFP